MSQDGDHSVSHRGEPEARQTFLFGDLSGFTALTEAHGDEQAADLVEGYCDAVRRLLPDHHAHEVKSIGDAMMIRTTEAAAAIRLGLSIVHDVGAQSGFPQVRVGMHTGSAVERSGDWFGATVNLAARVSAAAAGGEALLTSSTRAAAGEVEGVELRERGRRVFRKRPRAGQQSSQPSGRALGLQSVCPSILSAGWPSTHGTEPAGSRTREWSTASVRSGAPEHSPGNPTGSRSRGRGARKGARRVRLPRCGASLTLSPAEVGERVKTWAASLDVRRAPFP